MKRKCRKKQQDKGNAEWLNEQHIRRRRRKKTPTHPCWHVWRLITMAAVSTDVELRGSCQSVRVCVCACRRLTVIWGLFSDDSCWHNAPFSLFIYTVQPISISSLFLTPSLFSLSIPRLQVPLFHPFLDISRLTGLWWDAHLLPTCSSNKWMPLAHPGTCGARLLLISFLEQ